MTKKEKEFILGLYKRAVYNDCIMSKHCRAGSKYYDKDENLVYIAELNTVLKIMNKFRDIFTKEERETPYNDAIEMAEKMFQYTKEKKGA